MPRPCTLSFSSRRLLSACGVGKKHCPRFCGAQKRIKEHSLSQGLVCQHIGHLCHNKCYLKIHFSSNFKNNACAFSFCIHLCIQHGQQVPYWWPSLRGSASVHGTWRGLLLVRGHESGRNRWRTEKKKGLCRCIRASILLPGQPFILSLLLWPIAISVGLLRAKGHLLFQNLKGQVSILVKEEREWNVLGLPSPTLSYPELCSLSLPSLRSLLGDHFSLIW